MYVYLVFYYENGAYFLDCVFGNSKDAQHYIESMPTRLQHNYKLQTWEVE